MKTIAPLFIAVFVLLSLCICSCGNTPKEDVIQRIEDRNISTLNDNNTAESSTENYQGNLDVLPSSEEIDKVKCKLPIKVDEYVEWVNIEYDSVNLIEIFEYKHLIEVDESMISDEVLYDLKKNLIEGLKISGGIKRIKAGVTYIYRYYSVDDRLLYDIKIESNDF